MLVIRSSSFPFVCLSLLRALLIGLASGGGLAAQSLFEALPVDAEHPLLPGAAFAAVDVDGDGDLDVVAGARLHLNDGNGRYRDVTSTSMPALSAEPKQIHSSDLNGDSEVDLVFLVGDGVRVLIGSGNGRFVNASAGQLPPVSNCVALALGDVDGDGDTDLALGRADFPQRGSGALQNQLFLNDGTGRFVDGASRRLLPTMLDQTQTMVMADLDGDGDLDLAVGNHSHFGMPPSRALFNDGTGRFRAVPWSRYPSGLHAWEAYDLSGDGVPELMAPDGLYWNAGRGVYVADPILPGARPGHAAVFDVDGDGDLDLLVTAPVSEERGARVYLWTQAGFAEATSGRGLELVRGRVEIVDWDGDGDEDLLCENGVRHLNDGSGVFLPAWRRALPSLPPAPRNFGQGIVAADFDLDGSRDLAFGDVLYLQCDRGRFAEHTESRLPPISTQRPSLCSSDLDVIDLEGDGDPDLVRVAYGLVQLLVNDGSARFVAVNLPFAAHASAAVDVDGDGDADLVLAAHGPDTLLLNDGRGNFVDATSGRLPAVEGTGAEVSAADVDGDGALDLIFAHGGWEASGARHHRNRLFLNNGRGVFRDVTETNLPTGVDDSWSISVGDVNLDGSPDLLFGNSGRDRLLLNDGTGAFRDVSSSHLPSRGRTRDTCLGDVDEDGDLDLVVAQADFRSGRPGVFLNDGSGRFQDRTTVLQVAPWIEATGGTSSSIALHDMDGDGDQELILSYGHWLSSGQGGVGAQPPRSAMIFHNLRRQLEAPRLAFAGRGYQMHVHARGARPGPVDVALVFLSRRPGRVPVPGVGMIGLDLSAAVSLAPKVIPRPARVTFRVDLPAGTAFVGVDLYSQAAVLGWPSEVRLTNVTRDRVVR